MEKIFIHTNKKQEIAAIISKYSIEKNLSNKIPVQILYVEEFSNIMENNNKKYLRSGKKISFNISDLQSFTLLRFLIPEYCGFEGNALVIDPDIFVANNTDLNQIFKFKGPYKIKACYDYNKNCYKSSVMLLNNSELKHWNSKIIEDLFNFKLDYSYLLNLQYENDVIELEKEWNEYDILTDATKLLHFTNRITQPWKTGLNIDFDLIPKYSINNILKNYMLKKFVRYKNHNDHKSILLFYSLFREAYKNGYLSLALINYHIDNKNLKRDILEII